MEACGARGRVGTWQASDSIRMQGWQGWWDRRQRSRGVQGGPARGGSQPAREPRWPESQRQQASRLPAAAGPQLTTQNTQGNLKPNSSHTMNEISKARGSLGSLAASRSLAAAPTATALLRLTHLTWLNMPHTSPRRSSSSSSGWWASGGAGCGCGCGLGCGRGSCCGCCCKWVGGAAMAAAAVVVRVVVLGLWSCWCCVWMVPGGLRARLPGCWNQQERRRQGGAG